MKKEKICSRLISAAIVALVMGFVLAPAGCASGRSGKSVPVETTVETVAETTAKTEAKPDAGTAGGNYYKNIPVEVTGIPYEYKDICGNHTIDYVIDKEYELMSTGQSSRFVNFKINKFIFDFKNDGSLVVSSVSSYDKTPAQGNSYYPANPNSVHEWKLTPLYHRHLEGPCSLDRYNDIAVSQAKLNEMRKDPALDKVYKILLSCAQDMDYDYNRVGIRVKFVQPTPLTGVCDDYAALLISRLSAAGIKGVSDIVKVTGYNHAWVTLKYKGKTLYLDATWFDKNSIDETGTVVHDPYKDPREMTFDNDIFTNHGKHHIPS
ncbi:MAG: transglutaminase domain-containing protein [Treponema sp.]|jgi:hypothetical protein|nr:transglutaminase domain-containing protein [Treponema sp.]